MKLLESGILMENQVCMPLSNDSIRQAWIDIFRGILIILVVVGHLYIPQQLYRVIFSFHMYGFFFLTGVTWKSEKYISIKLVPFLKNNMKKLYRPYLVFAIFWNVTDFAVNCYMNGFHGISFVVILKNVLGILLCNGFGLDSSIGPAWYLVCLLLVKIAYYLLTRVLKKAMNKGIACCLLFVLGFLLNGVSFIPFKIIPGLTAILFVFLGEEFFILLLPRMLHFLKNKCFSTITIILCLITTALLAMVQNTDLILAGNQLPDNIFLLLGASLCGILGIYLINVN